MHSDAGVFITGKSSRTWTGRDLTLAAAAAMACPNSLPSNQEATRAQPLLTELRCLLLPLPWPCCNPLRPSATHLVSSAIPPMRGHAASMQLHQ